MERASGVHERRNLAFEHRATSAGGPAGTFSHEALLHAGDDAFASGGAAFVKAALAMNESVLVAVGAARQVLLREALGDEGRQVMFSDITNIGRNPARLIPAWRRFLEEYGSDGRGVHVLAEAVWPGRTRAEVSECRRYEGLVNVAFQGGRAWRLLCAYDTAALDADVIELARTTHPLLRVENETGPSPSYVGVEAVDPFDGKLPHAPEDAPALAFTIASLHEVREFVSATAQSAELPTDSTDNLRLAVNEIASNSVRHGGGAGTLRTWREDGALICEVGDRGRIGEPLVGRLHPSPDQASGRGLWLVNHLCDLVQIRSSREGSVVRVHMKLAVDDADGPS
jgi:anti-sigma regulatory factor (Ser/Thr protein kinase)